MGYRLARVCGRLDVEEMLDEVSPERLNGWIAYYRIEPFGDDWGPPTKICETIANILVTEEKDLAEADEFRPLFQGQKRRSRRQKRMVKPEQAMPALQAIYGNNRNTSR